MLKKLIYRMTHWETWPWLLKYIPITPVWTWYCLRSRNPWFFTASNPTLMFGGFMGETKREMYRQLPKELVPNGVFVSPLVPFDQVKAQLESHNLVFPLAVKPDVGMMGFMFRKIGNISQLRQYHDVMTVNYIIQDYIEQPMEVSVFYYRMPNRKKGHITGFIKKEYLQVTGDGKSTLLELIQAYARADYRQEELKARHRNRLMDILPEGAVYRLSDALNLSRGGKLVSLEDKKDSRLMEVFDGLSHHSGNLYYGRYDIKCRSIEDLKAGKNFCILEFNGAGAEPHHVYGYNLSLWKACGELARHWGYLYRISRINHLQKGVPYWNYAEGMSFAKKARVHYKKLKALDRSFCFDEQHSYATANVSASLAGI